MQKIGIYAKNWNLNLEFSLISPVSARFLKSLKNSCVRRKHRIKILKTVCTRYCHDLVHTVPLFSIRNTGKAKKFFEKNEFLEFLL